MDQYEKKPIESYRNAQGEIQFSDTGDDLVDRWEEQIARGEIPDLLEAFDEDSLKHLQRIKDAQRARDPYQAMTIRDTSDKMMRILQSEKVEGFRNMPPAKQQELEELFGNPTFGGIPEDE